MNNYVTAIDLGTTKVIIMVGEKTESGYRIIAYREAPTKGVIRGEVVNIQNVLDSLLPLINDIKNTDHIDIQEVYVGIAGQNIQCNLQSLPRNRSRSEDLISEAEVEEMAIEMTNCRVKEGEKILHVIPQSYNVDDHIGVDSASGMTGKSIEGIYKLFIGKTISVDHSKIVIQKAGLKLKDLILEPIASAKAVLTEDDMEMGVAMVDMGGGTTDLLIYYNNIIRHTAVIPFGGNSITEDLRQGCNVSLKNAELIKTKYGSCFSEYAPDNKSLTIPGTNVTENRSIPFKLIASIIEARVEELIEAIMYEIKKSGYINKLGAGIVITGGGSQLTNLRQLVKYTTGFSTRIASPTINITSDTPKHICNPAAATAFGLVIHGFEKPRNFIDAQPTNDTLFQGIEMEISEVAPKETSKTKQKQTKKKASFKSAIDYIVGNIFENTNNEA